MATVAHNRGQDLITVDAAKTPNAPGTVALGNYGATPVQTEGKPSDTPTRVAVAGRTLVEAYLVNGTWEAVIDLDKQECLFACDTPNVRIVVDKTIFGGVPADRVQITKYNYEYPPRDAAQAGWDFRYPGFSKYVRLASMEK